VRHDKIAQDMWDNYVRICEERGIGDNSDESSDNSYDEEED